mmetsp:Transcript_96067/g.277442  ORF Transcript_96067/g.277442 Transcript_96067/m.277442 type:complete len:269 (-) Transcript_96067:1506-2312(-)
MRTQQPCAISRSRSFSPSSAKMAPSAWPVTISARCSKRRSPRAASARPMASSSSSMMAMVISGVSTFVLKPMFRAVSSLSPVSTHNLIPARRMFSMASGTPSCNLSSIAVAPRIVMDRSTPSATSASFCSRSWVARFALSYPSRKPSTSLLLSLRAPITRVRKPCIENSFKCCSNTGCFVSVRSSITLSAPFTRSMYSGGPPCPPFSTTTDIRFRAELKAFVAKTVYVARPPVRLTSTQRSLPRRPLKAQPRSATPLTKAYSSGLSAS